MALIKALCLVSASLLLFTGVSPQAIYSRAGDSITLRCDRLQHHGPNCSDVDWEVYKLLGTVHIYRVSKGKVQDSSSRLNSDCSLSLHNVTEEDSGLFFCGVDGHSELYASVYLRVLTVSPAPADSSPNPDEHMILKCSLGKLSGNCNDGNFRWLDQNNKVLSEQTDTCVSNLTVERQSELGRTFTCQYLESSEVKVSVEYRLNGNKNTGQPKDPEDDVTDLTIPAPNGNCEDSQASAGWWWFLVLKTVSWSALISTTVIVSICTRKKGKPKRSEGDFEMASSSGFSRGNTAPPADYENQ